MVRYECKSALPGRQIAPSGLLRQRRSASGWGRGLGADDSSWSDQLIERDVAGCGAAAAARQRMDCAREGEFAVAAARSIGKSNSRSRKAILGTACVFAPRAPRARGHTALEVSSSPSSRRPSSLAVGPEEETADAVAACASIITFVVVGVRRRHRLGKQLWRQPRDRIERRRRPGASGDCTTSAVVLLFSRCVRMTRFGAINSI
uniref:Uncharacterized protein n=1 Tax=Steinernema glaseri TaxID=37863 RepID=A0A1I8A9Y2_9BILA